MISFELATCNPLFRKIYRSSSMIPVSGPKDLCIRTVASRMLSAAFAHVIRIECRHD